MFHLRVFGCKAFAHVPDEKRTKLESKSMPCVFLGYCEGTKAYHLMCVETKRIIKSRDVVFIQRSKEIGGVLHPKKVENVVAHEIVNKEVEGKEPLTLSWVTPLNEATIKGVQSESTPNSSSKEKFVISNDDPSNELSEQVSRERPQRQQREWLRDCWIATKEVELATVTFLEEPQNIEKALTCENSKECEFAMQEEYDSLMAKRTWTLVPLLVNRKPISCKWVFKIKQGPNGDLERYKAALMARNFTQTYGVDYNKTFVPHHKIFTYSLYFCISDLGKHGDPSNGCENHISRWRT